MKIKLTDCFKKSTNLMGGQTSISVKKTKEFFTGFDYLLFSHKNDIIICY